MRFLLLGITWKASPVHVPPGGCQISLSRIHFVAQSARASPLGTHTCDNFLNASYMCASPNSTRKSNCSHITGEKTGRPKTLLKTTQWGEKLRRGFVVGLCLECSLKHYSNSGLWLQRKHRKFESQSSHAFVYEVIAVTLGMSQK